MKTLRKTSIFERLKQDICKQIETDKLKVGDQILPEEKLSELYGISIRATRAGISDLVNQEYLKRIQGKGTFVSKSKTNVQKEEYRKVKTIGVIVADLVVSTHANIVQAIESYVYERDYQMFLGNSENNTQKEQGYMHKFCDQKIDGMIVVTGKNSTKNKYFQSLNRKSPLVIIDTFIEGVQAADFVTTDDITGACEVIRHLTGLGHRRIAHLAGWPDVSTSRNILTGYKKALNEVGIEFNENLVKQTDYTEESGYSTMKELLVMKNRPTAVFTVTDMVAVGAAEAIQESNLRIPDDISLAGFSDQKGLNTDISLTTVSQPAYEMGKKAAEILFEKIKGQRKLSDMKEIILPTRLVIRTSSGICLSQSEAVGTR